MAKVQHENPREKSKRLAKKTLDIKRCAIDLIDDRLVYLLGQRIKVVKKIAGLKKKLRISILQKKRIAEVLKKRKQMARKYGISPLLIEKLYKEIIQECMRIEKRISE